MNQEKDQKIESKPKEEAEKKAEEVLNIAGDKAEEEKTVIEKIESKTVKIKKVAKKGKTDYSIISTDQIKPGMIIRVHQKIVDTNSKGEEKERIQVFQGMVLARKHGRQSGATITVRKISEGIGVEKIFPINMPSLAKFELVRNYRIRRAKPYYLRTYKKRLTEIK